MAVELEPLSVKELVNSTSPWVINKETGEHFLIKSQHEEFVYLENCVSHDSRLELRKVLEDKYIIARVKKMDS